jgi:hypothetical protein
VAADIHVQQVIHIAGVDNDKCDRLSRRGSNSTVSVAEEAPIGVVGTVEVNREDSIMGVLRLCDPRRKMTSESEFVAFWSEFSQSRGVHQSGTGEVRSLHAVG